MAPISPFYADRLYTDLITATGRDKSLSTWLNSKYQEEMIDKELEARMQMAQDVTSMVLALRRKVNIKVRQPPQCIMIPVADEEQKAHIEACESIDHERGECKRHQVCRWSCRRIGEEGKM